MEKNRRVGGRGLVGHLTTTLPVVPIIDHHTTNYCIQPNTQPPPTFSSHKTNRDVFFDHYAATHPSRHAEGRITWRDERGITHTTIYMATTHLKSTSKSITAPRHRVKILLQPWTNHITTICTTINHSPTHHYCQALLPTRGRINTSFDESDQSTHFRRVAPAHCTSCLTVVPPPSYLPR